MRNGASDAIPEQRVKDLVIRAHGEETLVLDRRSGTVHCLPAEVTRVWSACTGSNTLAEIASAAGTDGPTAAAAVDQLILLDLLEGRTGFDRRKFLRRSAVVGAGAAAVPVIESVVASPAFAASPAIGALQYQCSSTNGRVKGLVVPLIGFSANTRYNVMVTIGPTPSNSVVAGQTFTTTVQSGATNASGNVSVSATPSQPLGAVPGTLGPGGAITMGPPTPVTISVFTTTGTLVKTFTTTIGPCSCSTNVCAALTPPTLTVAPGCTGTNMVQANITYTLTGGLASTSYNFAWASTTPPVSNNTSQSTNASGSVTFTSNIGGNNTFNGISSTVTITVRQGGSSGPIVATTTLTVGPCPPVAAGSARTAPSGSPSPGSTSPSNAPAPTTTPRGSPSASP